MKSTTISLITLTSLLTGCGGSSGGSSALSALEGTNLPGDTVDNPTHQVCGDNAQGELQTNISIDNTRSAVSVDSAFQATYDLSLIQPENEFNLIFTLNAGRELAYFSNLEDFYCSADKFSNDACNVDSEYTRVTTTVANDEYTSTVQRYDTDAKEFTDFATVHGKINDAGNMDIRYSNGYFHVYTRSSDGTETITATYSATEISYSMVEHSDCSGSYHYSRPSTDTEISASWTFNGTVSSGSMTYSDDTTGETTLSW